MKMFTLAFAAMAAICLAACQTTNGVPVLTAPAQSNATTVLTDAQSALTVADLAVGVAEATNELPAATATKIDTVLTDFQDVLTAAHAGDSAATATTVAAKIADAQTALTAIKAAAPQDAQLISAVQSVLTTFAAVETALPAS